MKIPHATHTPVAGHAARAKRGVRSTPSLLSPLSAVLVAVCLAFAQAPALANNPKAAKLYEDALTRFEKEDVRGAIVQLKNALQIDRNLLPVHVLLGRALLAESDVIGAEVAFNEALRLGVNRAEVVVPLAQALVGQGKLQALFSDPRLAAAGLLPGVRAPLMLILGGAHADLGRPAEALKAIEEARAIEPASADSHLAEVPIRIRAREFAQAVAAADRALALAPNLAEAHYLRGSIAHAQSNLADAQTAYTRALRIQPEHLESLLARAGIALDQNRVTEAKLDLAAARRSQPKEPRAAYLSAVIAEREGDAKAARALMTEITGLIDPVPAGFMRYRPQLLILGGLAHHGLGEFEKARPYFETVQRDQPASPVSKLLAQIHMAENNAAAAINVLDAYLRLQPRDVQALSLLASAHISQGRHARATQLLQTALSIQDDPQLRTLLGLSLAGAGKAVEALAPLEAALARDPGQIQAGAALVSLYLRDGRGKKAVNVAEALVKRQPKQPGLHNLLGLARMQLGDAARARTAFEQAGQLDAAYTEPRLNLARLDIQAGQLDKAAARLNELLKADEKQVDVLTELARLAERRGQTSEATRFFTKAADHASPSDVQPLLALVDYHLRGQRYESAQAAVRQLEGKAPEDVRVQVAVARVALGAGKQEAARTALVKASRIVNFDAPGQTSIALLQLAAGDARGAAYSLSKALQADPTHLPAQALMVDVDVRLGDLDAAEKMVREIQSRQPQLALGHALAGDVASASGNNKAAIDSYRRAQQVEPNSQNLLRLYRAQLSTEPQVALQLVEQWLRKRPQDALVWRALADGHASRGNMLAARVAYEQLLKQVPGEPESLNNYAHVLLQLKDVAGAQRAADQALAAKPDAPHILGTAGWMAYQGRQPDRALQLLREARLRDPANSDTRYYLAEVLAQSGRASEARAELQAALRSGAGFGTAREAQRLLDTLR